MIMSESNQNNTLIGNQSNIEMSDLDYSFIKSADIPQLINMISICQYPAINELASQLLHKLILLEARNKLKDSSYFLNCSHNFEIYCDTESNIKIYGHTFKTEYRERSSHNQTNICHVRYTKDGVKHYDQRCILLLPNSNWLACKIMCKYSVEFSKELLYDIYRYFIAMMMGELIRYFNLSLINLIIDYLE